MALSKRVLIKRSKSYWRPRSINVLVTITDLSDVLQTPVVGVRVFDTEPSIAYEDLPTVEPRGPGISKLFEGLL